MTLPNPSPPQEEGAGSRRLLCAKVSRRDRGEIEHRPYLFEPFTLSEFAMHRSLSHFVAILFALLSVSVTARAEMPRMELSAGFHRIEVEVAANDTNRTQGLMFRKNMAANQGMLFVFSKQDRHCMWMRNTLLPLSVAFLDEEGRILNVEDMQPQTETSHCAAGPARFALEMNLGWFSGKGLKPGLRIGGIEKSPRPQ